MSKQNSLTLKSRNKHAWRGDPLFAYDKMGNSYYKHWGKRTRICHLSHYFLPFLTVKSQDNKLIFQISECIFNFYLKSPNRKQHENIST